MSEKNGTWKRALLTCGYCGAKVEGYARVDESGNTEWMGFEHYCAQTIEKGPFVEDVEMVESEGES